MNTAAPVAAEPTGPLAVRSAEVRSILDARAVRRFLDGKMLADGITDATMDLPPPTLPRPEYALGNPQAFEREHVRDWWDAARDMACAMGPDVLIGALVTGLAVWGVMG